MGFNLNSLKTNKDKETEGVWVDYLDGSRLLIGRMGNAKFKAFVSRKYKGHRMAIDRGDAHADALAETIQVEGYARFILLGWEGVELDGKMQDYTPELGMKVMHEIPDFKADVENFANETNVYLESNLEKDSTELKKQ